MGCQCTAQGIRVHHTGCQSMLQSVGVHTIRNTTLHHVGPSPLATKNVGNVSRFTSNSITNAITLLGTLIYVNWSQ